MTQEDVIFWDNIKTAFTGNERILAEQNIQPQSSFPHILRTGRLCNMPLYRCGHPVSLHTTPPLIKLCPPTTRPQQRHHEMSAYSYLFPLPGPAPSCPRQGPDTFLSKSLTTQTQTARPSAHELVWPCQRCVLPRAHGKSC